MSLTVALDGPAGAGKSTVARQVAIALDFTYLDTGAMYRAVAFKALVAGTDPTDEAGLMALADAMCLMFGPLTTDALQTVTLDGEDVTTQIRTPEVSNLTSAISALPGVRRVVVAQQRRIGSSAPRGVVLEGRDIGSVVFPQAEVKIFLTASEEERARRRMEELQARGLEVNYGDILADQQERDRRDSYRAASPLIAAPDAIIIDTDALSVASVVAQIVGLVQAAQTGRPVVVANTSEIAESGREIIRSGDAA